jgi:kynureninase
LQAKSRALTGWLDARLRRDFAGSIDVITPAAPAARGSQLSLRFRGGNSVGRSAFDALTAHGVVADWREPDVIRVAPVPLYNRYADAARLLLQLDQVLERA